MKLTKKIQIAIDGPVGAGKSTVAYLLAKKLSILYIDTGAMYRATALLGLQHNLDLKDEQKLTALLKKSTLKLYSPKNNNRFCTVFLNNKDVTKKIRTPRVSWGSSTVAVLPGIRKHLVKLQQQMAQQQSVIMEGRDIATVVLPQADLKIYMTASSKERARRRYQELLSKNVKVSFNSIVKETKKRDRQDSGRETDPLVVAPDAWLLKTTNLTINQVVEKTIQRLKNMKLITSSKTQER